MSRQDYMVLADALALEIASGKLPPGYKLPPQRIFAYEKGIATSTASRVYAELLRRGLVKGEVGRGTFVAGQANAIKVSDRESHDGRVDLEFNFPILPSQSGWIAKSLSGLHRADALDAALRPVGERRLAAAREVAASFLARKNWSPASDSFIFTGGGKQAIAAAIAALSPVGSRLAVESVTYPMIKAIAARLGVSLVSILVDADGMDPDALESAQKKTPLSAIYLQPVLHNPLGITLSPRRRSEIIKVAQKHGLFIIEDHVYGFLTDDEPLAASAPDQCIFVDSMSKRIAPGLGLGFISAPRHIHERVATSTRGGALAASGFGLEAGLRLMSDGTAMAITAEKARDAVRRQELAARCLEPFVVQADPRAYHLWLILPEGWRSEAFAAAAARQGIAVTPSSAFTIMAGHAPNAVRLAISQPPMEVLEDALSRLSALLRAGPEAAEIVE